tara:strand:- start:290 stop:580 length:291 start_codon:yes stop_codon:yes gene_type:complete
MSITHINLFSSLSLENGTKTSSSVLACFGSKKIDICQEALIQLEALQLKEASRENYSCQTRILGLQADVIMAMQDSKSKRSYKTIFDEVDEYCDNF